MEDLLVLTWCSWSGRALQRDGKAYTPPRLGQLPDDVELLRPELPTPAHWAEAVDRAGHLFGIALSGRSLNARNLTSFVERIHEKCASYTAADPLAASLEERVRCWAGPDDAPRLATARAASELRNQLQNAQGAAVVRALVEFTPQTSLTAMGRSYTTAEAAHRLLSERPRWIVFEQIRNLTRDPTKEHRASLLLKDLNALLSADEVNQMLADGLAELTRQAEDLLRVSVPPEQSEPGWETALTKSVRIESADDLASTLRLLADEVETAAAGSDELRVDVWG